MGLKIGVAPTDIFLGLASVYPKFLPNPERAISPNWCDNCYLFNHNHCYLFDIFLKMANLEVGGVAPNKLPSTPQAPAPPGGAADNAALRALFGDEE